MSTVVIENFKVVAEAYRALGRSRDEFLQHGWDATIARGDGKLMPSDMFYTALDSPATQLSRQSLKDLMEKAWPEPVYGGSVQALMVAIRARAQAWMKGGYSMTLGVAKSVEEHLADQGWLLVEQNGLPRTLMGWDAYLVDTDLMIPYGPVSSARDALEAAREAARRTGDGYVVYGLLALSHAQLEQLSEIELGLAGTNLGKRPESDPKPMIEPEPRQPHVLPEKREYRRLQVTVDEYGTKTCHLCGLGMEPPTDGTMEYVSILGSPMIHCHNACRHDYLNKLADDRAKEREIERAAWTIAPESMPPADGSADASTCMWCEKPADSELGPISARNSLALGDDFGEQFHDGCWQQWKEASGTERHELRAKLFKARVAGPSWGATRLQEAASAREDRMQVAPTLDQMSPEEKAAFFEATSPNPPAT